MAILSLDVMKFVSRGQGVVKDLIGKREQGGHTCRDRFF
jgi:hypothetical protein